MKPNDWNEAEKRFLRLNSENMYITDLGQALREAKIGPRERSDHAVKQKIHVMKLPFKKMDLKKATESHKQPISANPPIAQQERALQHDINDILAQLLDLLVDRDKTEKVLSDYRNTIDDLRQTIQTQKRKIESLEKRKEMVIRPDISARVNKVLAAAKRFS